MFWICMAVAAHTAVKKASEVDEELLFAIASGDSDAFSEFYNQTKTAVYSFAMSILKNPHDAEDIMQDAYIKIHANACSYKPEGKPLAWVFTIVRNLCLMHLRSKKNKDAGFIDELDYENPENFAKNVEDGAIIAAAMKALGDEERQIVIMHAVSGMKHREIGEMLGIPLSTVLSKYNRALAKLKNQLA